MQHGNYARPRKIIIVRNVAETLLFNQFYNKFCSIEIDKQKTKTTVLKLNDFFGNVEPTLPENFSQKTSVFFVVAQLVFVF